VIEATNRPIRLLNLGPQPFWRTQAVYHAVAELMQPDSPDTLIITRPATPYLCLGYHDIYDVVLDRAACARLGLPVVRRRVGGGTTYLDANQLFYQCIFHHERVPARADAIYAQMLAAPVATLRRLGLNAALRDAFELEIEGRRIAGIGGGRIGEAAVIVGNLLFDFDYHSMAQVWRAPSSSFRELAAKALAEHLVTLRQLLGPLEIETVQPILQDEFAKAFGRPLEPGVLTEVEEEHVTRVGERQISAEYLALHSQHGAIGLLKRLKISGGVFIHADKIQLEEYMIQASFRVREEVIVEARLESTPLRNWKLLETGLQNVPFKLWQQQLTTLWLELDALRV
jgi:lipoate---protein ligase